jgi:hypothetical protein
LAGSTFLAAAFWPKLIEQASKTAATARMVFFMVFLEAAGGSCLKFITGIQTVATSIGARYTISLPLVSINIRNACIKYRHLARGVRIYGVMRERLVSGTQLAANPIGSLVYSLFGRLT